MTARLLREAEARSQAASAPPSGGGSTTGSVDQIVSDMYSATGPWNVNRGNPWNKSDQDPSGVPSGYSWADGADSYAATFTNDGSAVRTWFWVGKTSVATGYDLRIEIKTPIFQFLVGGVWTTQTALTNPENHNFDQFGAPGVGDQGAITRRSESGDGATAFSWTLSGLSGVNTYFTHGWWDNGGSSGGGYSAIPSSMTATHCSMQMRLITDVAGNPALGKFVGVMGSDKITFPSGVYTNVGGYGQARAKWVTNSWQAFSFTSGNLTEAQIRANPPTVQT